MVRRDQNMSGEERLITARLGTELRVLLDKPLLFLPCSDYLRRGEEWIYSQQNKQWFSLWIPVQKYCTYDMQLIIEEWIVFLHCSSLVLISMCELVCVCSNWLFCWFKTLEILSIWHFISISPPKKPREHYLTHILQKFHMNVNEQMNKKWNLCKKTIHK